MAKNQVKLDKIRKLCYLFFFSSEIVIAIAKNVFVPSLILKLKLCRHQFSKWLDNLNEWQLNEWQFSKLLKRPVIIFNYWDKYIVSFA